MQAREDFLAIHYDIVTNFSFISLSLFSLLSYRRENYRLPFASVSFDISHDGRCPYKKEVDSNGEGEFFSEASKVVSNPAGFPGI